MDGNTMWQQGANQGYQQPMEDGNKKKGGKGPVIAIVLILLALLLGAGGFCIYQFVFNTPEARLAKGIANFTQDMSMYGAGWQEETGLAELIQNMEEENSSSVDLKLNVTLPESETLGIDYYQNYDGKNQLMEAEVALSFFNINLLKAELAADEEHLYVSVPDIVEEWYCLNTETIGADYQDSVWRELTGMDVPEDFGFSVFEELGAEDTALQEDMEELMEEYAAKFAEGATIEDSGNVVEIKRDGKTVRCEGVCVTVEKEVINDFFEDFFELYEEYYEAEAFTFELEVKKDVKLCFYMDNKNRIVNISTPEKIKFSGTDLEAIGFSLVFSGTDNVLDEISGNGEVEVTDALGEDITFEIERTAENRDSALEEEWVLTIEGESGHEVVMEYTSATDLEDLTVEGCLKNTSNGEVLELFYEVACSDVEKGESLTFDIDEFMMTLHDKEIYKMTGSISMGILEEEIKMPDDAVDFMNMTEAGLMDIVTGLRDYIEQFEELLYY